MADRFVVARYKNLYGLHDTHNPDRLFMGEFDLDLVDYTTLCFRFNTSKNVPPEDDFTYDTVNPDEVYPVFADTPGTGRYYPALILNEVCIVDRHTNKYFSSFHFTNRSVYWVIGTAFYVNSCNDDSIFMFGHWADIPKSYPVKEIAPHYDMHLPTEDKNGI